MNLALHDIDSQFICGDSLSSIGANIPKADLIITNPPFGNKKGGSEQEIRDDLTFKTSNKQLNFLQHIYNNLKPSGRAAVVLPDNVLFVSNGRKIREDFFKKCKLHTVLRLPFGIFYAGGIRTNVIFFDKKNEKESQNKFIWYYDMRTNHKIYSKTNPLTNKDFEHFKSSYSKDIKDRKENNFFKRVAMSDIEKNHFDLDIQFIKEHEYFFEDENNKPKDLLEKILTNLNEAKKALLNV
jgi:type I restriction enzyme M protein